MNLFKRLFAPKISKAEHERLLTHARYQRDYWMAEAKRLAVEHQRRIAPLMAANAARKAAAQAKKSRDKQQAGEVVA